MTISGNLQKRMEDTRTCVLLPTYNNNATLAGVVQRIRSIVGPHLLVIDDGIKDGAGGFLASIGGIDVLRSERNQGKAYALVAGFYRQTGSLWDETGTMYAHGLASIALCEAYGMTHDQSLQTAAQSAVNFIVFAQDPQGGGWRYSPQTPGDTSAVGWQLMAPKSAQMAYRKVPPATMKKAGYFLDHVQGEKGAVYGYQSPDGRRPATTAIGLLSRMYLGWKHDHLPLQHGVQILAQLGPSTDRTGNKNNMYYNYYATQVMHHYGGYPWQRWNAVMREYLIKSQEDQGHEAGSWYLPGTDDGSRAGGRLYCTAMAAMTLEVYYRYMPLYRPQSTATPD